MWLDTPDGLEEPGEKRRGFSSRPIQERLYLVLDDLMIGGRHRGSHCTESVFEEA